MINTQSLYWFRWAVLLWFCFPSAALGQVTADGTLKTSVSTPDRLNFTIESGNQVGGNLFHSFRSFSVPTGGSAVFNHAVDVQNIIGRVTGGSVSNIDGLIRANGRANLFLINPSGIVFGPNASLNIGGSFIGSTANSLRFADGTEFDAVNPSAPLLTISVPVGLQIGATSGAIRVQGAGNSLTLDANGSVDRIDRPVGLQVSDGQTLALVGGAVNLEGGNLTAAGRIELGSVANGSVRLSQSGSNWILGYEGVGAFRDIQLTQAASIDTSGVGAGGVRLQGRSVFLKDGSAIMGYTSGNRSGEDLVVQASDSVELSGANAFGIPSILETRVESGAIANAGNVLVQANNVLLQSGATVTSNTYGRGNSGSVTFQAGESVELSGLGASGSSSVISTIADSLTVGSSGDVTIETGRLLLRDGAQVRIGQFAEGKSGNLTIRAADVELSGANGNGLESYITSQVGSNGVGNAGNLTIETNRLKLQDGAFVSSLTFGRGNSSNLTIRAADAVELSGVNRRSQASSITTVVDFDGVGNSGDLTIETKRLQLQDGAGIATATLGRGNGGNLMIQASDAVQLSGSNGSLLTTQVAPTGIGNAGNLTIDTRQLWLQDGAQISSSVFGRGNGGNLMISAAEFVQLGGASSVGRGATRTNAIGTNVEVGGEGNAGNLTLETGRLILRDRAFITSSTRGFGNAGDLVVRAKDSILVDYSALSAAAELGGRGQAGNLTMTTNRLTLENNGELAVSGQGDFPAGNLTINANSIRLNNRASLRAETEAGDRGSIFLNAKDILLRRNSTITTNATNAATGGNITLNSDVLVLTENSAIVAQAILGRGGNITITTQGLFQSPGTRIDASSALGINGNVQINIPDVDPSRQVVRLPDRIIDPAQLIANSCLVPSARRQGTFVISGAGGLPALPTSPLRSPFQTYTIPTHTITSAQIPSTPPSSIAEAQGIYQLENGGSVLGRICH